MNDEYAPRLRYAMIGGGRDAFIGAVHRHAIALDGQAELAAGALSSTPERARESGRALGLADAHNHAGWQAFLEAELARPAAERVDLVVIVTPTDTHFPIAQAFAEAGFHVVCDKPLTHTGQQATTLVETVARQGTVFGVTYNYTGYPMVRQAREMVRSGALGRIRKVVVEYNQGWLATALEATGNKQASWRTDPARSGIAGALGDIGSHAENLVSTVTGLQIEELVADLGALVSGRALDDDASMLLRFKGGARGVLVASQINAGLENDLRLRVSGENGTLEWRQEEPNRLVHHRREGPTEIFTRASPWLCESARRAGRIPAGHPEGFIEAFANIYRGTFADIRARKAGTTANPLDADYPTVNDGARGVRFIECAVASSAGRRWLPFSG
ncbi:MULTISPECIES: Gfo/Idh/MocA family protein [Bosea]|uniref:Gfo/Idh/MocA family protein n=1 Tax=Bosea TaxID=85413 RepID=UPI0021504DC4|nr:MULTISPECIES: Gfo/Idh/MocA family oxidoreductase [Bosea]MCR4523698.1 Gfo/Idh/MocA family oxidoreductase [Bosea sp. 47.2.35]MDR6830093.1 putative dehydrogenase [Bosea robiniae]MDR6896946.1 putative dehydrogenase [Bosea sp. BE109]MDR7140373.1 putative dehydrogenase [Bosea sp. BE168]MDR7177040.1 putative dehydrogenase [Bosea sp. BE271]